MRHDFLRIRPRLRATFYAVFAVLFASGAGWWAVHAAANDEKEIVTAETWLLKVHGAGAMAALVVLGVLYPLHVLRGWKANRNRGWGAALVAACVALTVSGYLLYYSGGETIRAAATATHVWLGLALPILLVVHIRRGRATRM